VTPPEPEEVPPETELAVLEPPPLPSFTPDRERAPEPPTPETPVVDNTAEPPEETSAIDSVLASMQQPSAQTSAQGAGSDSGSGGRSGEGTAQSGARLTGAQLTLSEEEALRAQLKQCWNLLGGARDAQNLRVEVRAIVDQNRMPQSVEITGPAGWESDPTLRSAAEAARRAVLNPACHPLALPPDRYADWNVLNLIFDPQYMF
jgi:hypothetical protein